MASRRSKSGGVSESLALPGFEPPPVAPVSRRAAPAAPPVRQDEAAEPPPHYTGHRDRLRQRFLNSGADGLQDYELLELLLFPVIPRRDVKPLAKDLIREFGGFWAVVTAPPERLRKVANFSDATIAAVTVVGAAALRATRQQVMNKPVLAGWEALLGYCQAAMAHEPNEQLRLLFLDSKNSLIADEVQQRGTINHTPAYPREIVRRALELGAHGVILVHNHPAGDPSPSRDDIHVTKEIARAASALGLVLHDHLIVARGQTVSFKALGLL